MERRLFYTVIFVFGLLGPHLAATPLLIGLAGLFLLSVWRVRLCTSVVLWTALLVLTLGYTRSYWDLHCTYPILPLQKIQVEGVILEAPRQWGNSSVFFFRVERLDHEPIRPTRILVRWSGCDQTLEVGDRWALQGRHGKGEAPLYPGGFDQRAWLWSQRATGVLQLHKFSSHHFLGPPTGYSPHQLSYRARGWMMHRLRSLPHEKARALVAGVVFGETQSLPRDLQEQFRRTGTSHLLAASGMNVALLAGLILLAGKLLGWGAWRVAPLAIPAVIAYAFLAGCSPSITRAAAGATLALTALSMGRTSNAWNTLSLSIWVLLLWDPRQLFDLGFQLSVVAVMGLVSGPTLHKRFGFLANSLVLTISASLATLPIFWWSFGELSSTLLLANLLLGPTVELLFPLGLLMTILPIRPLLFVCEWLARLSLWLVGWLSELADPVLLTRPGWLGWLLIAVAMWCWLKSSKWKVRWLALPLVASAIWLSTNAGLEPTCQRGELRVRKVGQTVPVYWVSTHSEDVLVLEEAWQEKRGRSMLRHMGCLRDPEIRVLNGTPLKFRWGRFRWEQVEAYLPSDSYVEVRVIKDHYFLSSWSSS
jgi:ComEC/Rec2-related protein